MAVQQRSHVEPERIVRVQLLPAVEEAAPGPKAPEAAAPPPAPRPPPPVRPKATAKPPVAKPPAKPVARKIVVPRIVAPASEPVVPGAAEKADGAPAAAAAGRGVAAVSSAPPGGAGGHGPGGGDELAAYVARVRTLLARQQRYPMLARRRGLEGEVLLRLRIGADGRLEDARTEGAAPRLFARSALDATERVGRFPAPPQGALSIEVPMRFRLDED